jgi:hypothetical protein
MTRMILAKGVGAALALAVMTGFIGQASAGLREYCDSYARDVASRKTDGKGAGTSANIGGTNGTVLGAVAPGDRYKRAYTNAFDRCVNNYEGARTRDAAAAGEAADQNVANKKAAASETNDTKAASTGEVTDDEAAASKGPEKKVAASKGIEKKVAANEAVNKDEACARKYRSYDPQIGKYKSLTGKWRPCRL